MKSPIFVRRLTATGRQQLQVGLRSADCFTVRRCQILLASADGLRPPHIARNLACAVRTVHHVIHAFQREGLACLQEKSSRPLSARPFLDEVWWSRLALPTLHAWTEDEPLRLVEQTTGRNDPDPKALCCYGLLRDDTGGMMLRFVQGRPVSQVTEDYLAWVCERLAAEGKKAITELDRLLTAQEVRERVCAYYGCEQVQPLEQGVA